MIRYYGLYSNAYRGKMRRAGAEAFHIPIIEDTDRHVASKGWAKMIRKVYEVDPLICSRCKGKMRIIAFITDYPIVDRILNHLKLTFSNKPLKEWKW